MASANVEEFNEETFNAALAASNAKPLVVDFWAPWCGPCRALGPVIEALAQELPNIKFGKVNVDENPDLAAKLGIQSIPALFYFKNGQFVGKSVGAKPKEVLRLEVEKLI